MEIQGTYNSQYNRKNNKVGEVTLSDFKMYCKVTVIRQCGTGMKIDIQIEGIESRLHK